jgi:CHAD domain-containing protein
LAFQTLKIEQQHALRKKSKRLRYALQFCESLFPESNLLAYRKQLAAVQDILGEMNDLYVKMRSVHYKPAIIGQLNIIVEAYKEEYRKRLMEDPKPKKVKEKK